MFLLIIKLFLPGITHEDVMWSFEISTYVKKLFYALLSHIIII